MNNFPKTKLEVKVLAPTRIASEEKNFVGQPYHTRNVGFFNPILLDI